MKLQEQLFLELHRESRFSSLAKVTDGIKADLLKVMKPDDYPNMELFNAFVECLDRFYKELTEQCNNSDWTIKYTPSDEGIIDIEIDYNGGTSGINMEDFFKEVYGGVRSQIKEETGITPELRFVTDDSWYGVIYTILEVATHF